MEVRLSFSVHHLSREINFEKFAGEEVRVEACLRSARSRVDLRSCSGKSRSEILAQASLADLQLRLRTTQTLATSGTILESQDQVEDLQHVVYPNWIIDKTFQPAYID